MRSRFKYFSLITSFLFCVLFLNAQEKSKISGRVLNANTGAPVENVNVYIAGSFLGASTDNHGNYIIDNVPFGKYTLIFSHVSYKKEERNIRIDLIGKHKFTVKLEPKPFELPEVSITDKKDTEWADNFKVFSECLLGKGEFSGGARILNPYSVSFGKNTKGNLTAAADGPIIIENRSLGYNILFFLDKFEYDNWEVKYSGIHVFDSLEAKDYNEKLLWKKNRVKAYAGSLRQFLTLLAAVYDKKKETIGVDTLVSAGNNNSANESNFNEERFIRQFGYKLYKVHKLPWEAHIPPAKFSLNLDSLISKGERPNELKLSCDMYICVQYLYEYDTQNLSIQKQPQQSWVKLHADEVSFDKKGRYFDEFMIQTFGTWANERVSDMIPFEYEVPGKILMNRELQ